jgi:hypothetical protein
MAPDQPGYDKCRWLAPVQPALTDGWKSEPEIWFATSTPTCQNALDGVLFQHEIVEQIGKSPK